MRRYLLDQNARLASKGITIVVAIFLDAVSLSDFLALFRDLRHKAVSFVQQTISDDQQKVFLMRSSSL